MQLSQPRLLLSLQHGIRQHAQYLGRVHATAEGVDSAGPAISSAGAGPSSQPAVSQPLSAPSEIKVTTLTLHVVRLYQHSLTVSSQSVCSIKRIACMCLKTVQNIDCLMWQVLLSQMTDAHTGQECEEHH